RVLVPQLQTFLFRRHGMAHRPETGHPEDRMMFPDFSCRENLVEEMDRPDSSEEKLFRTLDQFGPVNRGFSRYRTLLNRYVLSDLARHPSASRRLMDLGAGGCDIGRWLIRRCRERGFPLKITAVENDPRVARYARIACQDYPEIEVVEFDVRSSLPLKGVDYVFANHLLHHLPDEACMELIRKLDRAALRIYLLSDMIRSPWAYYGFRLCAALFFRNSFILPDGLASIRRSFTLAEAGELLRVANPGHSATLHSLAPHRFVILGDSRKEE
ncbi:MAG: methyltransferase domain-containing protein, partial [Kiritimatiellia bacterium]|nr:methyltransferase domain-containing protein [Kiritimatiellia bacterium]